MLVFATSLDFEFFLFLIGEPFAVFRFSFKKFFFTSCLSFSIFKISFDSLHNETSSPTCC